MICAHLAEAGSTEPPGIEDTDGGPGCQDCLAAGLHDWVHLRQCLTCGRVACCDSSPRRHATAHFHGTGHPVIRSAEPGEEWRWCYVDDLFA